MVSDHFINKKYEHLVFSNDADFDIYVHESKVRIKILCNFSGAKNLKIQVPGKPLIVKRALDLLGPYVGMTEKNIVRISVQTHKYFFWNWFYG